jgi:hypothetical protein
MSILEDAFSVAAQRWDETRTDYSDVSDIALQQVPKDDGWKVANVHGFYTEVSQMFYVTLWRVMGYRSGHAFVQLHGVLIQREDTGELSVQATEKLTLE